LGVSGDGRFVISADRDNRLLYWDLDAKTNKQISEQANIYSAYFVAGQPIYVWQDLSGLVRVQHVSGEILRKFEHHDTYGHALSSDLRHYISSDIGWGIHVKVDDRDPYVLKNPDGRSFIGFGKVLNLSLSSDGATLAAGGYGYSFDGKYTLEEEAERNHYAKMHGVTLWSLDTLEPIAKLPGNSSKTHATISPDGRWAVSVCENRMSYLWDLDSQEQIYAGASLHHGIYYPESDEHDWYFDDTGLIPLPDDFDARGAYIATKFISERYYLIFVTYSRYAVLFSVDSPLPVKYFDLGDDPFPAVSDYSRNLAIDTAPEAGILVMGQRDGAGILVYQFDPDELTLERVWVGR
jgi:WD40 repeat protein